MVGKHTSYDFNLFKFTDAFFLWLNIQSTLKNVPYALEKNVYILHLLGGAVYRCLLGLVDLVLFKSSIHC